jgi:hypothetical protein
VLDDEVMFEREGAGGPVDVDEAVVVCVWLLDERLLIGGHKACLQGLQDIGPPSVSTHEIPH